MIRFKQLKMQKVPRVDVVVINLHLSPFVEECLHGINYLAIDLKNPTIFFDFRFLLCLLRTNLRVSRLAAWVTAIAHASGSRVVLTMDNFDTNFHHQGCESLLHEIGTICASSKLLSIQHGQDLRRSSVTSCTKNVTLLCWGDWVRDNFPLFGRTEAKYVAVGALVNDLYLRIRPKVSKENALLLVSTVKDETWWGDESGERQRGYGELVDFVNVFSRHRSIRPVVALTIDRDHDPSINESELEQNWFKNRLNGNVQFTEPRSLFGSGGPFGSPARAPRYPKERYATYFLSDCSEVTIGMSSTVLWESFSRGNKILSINLTNNSIYNFPVDGVWSLQQPSYEEFSNRLEWILGMNDKEWSELSKQAREYLIRPSTTETVAERINREIRERIDSRTSSTPRQIL